MRFFIVAETVAAGEEWAERHGIAPTSQDTLILTPRSWFRRPINFGPDDRLAVANGWSPTDEDGRRMVTALQRAGTKFAPSPQIRDALAQMGLLL